VILERLFDRVDQLGVTRYLRPRKVRPFTTVHSPTAAANHNPADLAMLEAELNLINVDAALNRYIAASPQQLETYFRRALRKRPGRL
jgi:hypothetical protein